MRRPTLLGLALVLGACGELPDDTESTMEHAGGGKADDPTDPAEFACQNVSGLDGGLAQLLEHHDPIARLLLEQGDACPATYRQMVEKLRELDTEGCEDPATDLDTRIVSDDARLGDPNPTYRTVTTRKCSGRAAGELVWTLLNVNASEDIGARSFIEMAAFDPIAGVFNYYTLSGNRWNFEASSIGLLNKEASCASCHPSGGIIMKELDRPWIHWESAGFELPGVDALFAEHGDMFGNRADGEDLESVARAVNDRLNETRIRRFSTGETASVEDLLRPVFCPVEVNLDTAAEPPEGVLRAIPGDFLVDPFFFGEATPGVAMSAEVYAEAIAKIGQTVPGFADRKDVELAFVFPERSGIDNQYVEALVGEGPVTEEFVLDVLAVDFTRPLFSDARCELLAFAPAIDPSAPALGGDAEPEPAETVRIPRADAEQIRLGFIAALQKAAPAEGTAGAQLLANLLEEGDGERHRERVKAFLDACEARDEAEFMADAMQVVSGTRQRLRGMSIIEHQEQMPRIDGNPGTNLVLDPVTCALPSAGG